MTAPRSREPDAGGEDAPVSLSKTRRKKNMQDLQALGEALLDLSVERLNKLNLPDALYEAVREAQRLTGEREAKRRQLQYIGRLMRDIDPEPLREQIAEARGESDAATARLHQLENLRNRLLADESALTEVLAAYPAVDLTRLRQLRRNALKEAELGKPPKSYREIFQMLKLLAEGRDRTDEPAESGDDDGQ